MIREDPAEEGRAHVTGSLTGDAVQVLLDAVKGGVAVLDLSELDPIDDSAVRVLAALSPTRCALVGGPPGLELRLSQFRCNNVDF